MAVLDKLKFWKKKDAFPSLDLGAGLGKDVGGFSKDTTSGLGGTGELGFKPTDISLRGPGADTVFEEPKLTPSPMTPGYGGFQQQAKPDMMAKDIEIISSKLDAIRATLETVNQRLTNLENYLNDQKRRGW
jgi:hypothetical protein